MPRLRLIGWGSTKGVIEEACEILNERGHFGQSAPDPLARASARRGDSRDSERLAHTFIVENNYSGQFARYLP